MKLSVVQWTAIFSGVLLLIVGAHWALSSAPKPTITGFSPIIPITNAKNTTNAQPQTVSTQSLGQIDIAKGIPVYYSPTDVTIPWLT